MSKQFSEDRSNVKIIKISRETIIIIFLKLLSVNNENLYPIAILPLQYNKFRCLVFSMSYTCYCYVR